MNRFIFILFFISTHFSFSQSKDNRFLLVKHNYSDCNFYSNYVDSIVMSYDNLGFIIEEKHYDLTELDEISIVKKHTYNHNKIYQTIDLQTNGKSTVSDTVFKKDFFYTSNDTLQKIIFSKKINGNWVYTQKNEYQFDEKNKVSIEIIYNWNNAMNMFVPQHKEISKHNESHQVELVVRQVFNKEAWSITGKDSIVYKNGFKTENYSFYFDESEGGSWLKTSKETFAYNDNGKQLKKLIQNWSPLESNYVTDENTMLVVSFLDENDRLIKQENQMYHSDCKKFVCFDKTIFKYNNTRSLTVGNQLINNKLEIFPNPAFDFFTIHTSCNIRKVIVSDITGKIVKQIREFNPILSTYTIDISDLAEDLYFTSIETDEGTYTHTILIKD